MVPSIIILYESYNECDVFSFATDSFFNFCQSILNSSQGLQHILHIIGQICNLSWLFIWTSFIKIQRSTIPWRALYFYSYLGQITMVQHLFISLLESFPTEFSSKNRRNDDKKLEQHHFRFFTTERRSAPKFEFLYFRKRVFVFDKQDISSAGFNTVYAEDPSNHDSSSLPNILTI